MADCKKKLTVLGYRLVWIECLFAVVEAHLRPIKWFSFRRRRMCEAEADGVGRAGPSMVNCLKSIILLCQNV